MPLRATLELCLFRVLCSSRCLLYHLFKSEDKWSRDTGVPQRELPGSAPNTPLSPCAQAVGMRAGEKEVYHICNMALSLLLLWAEWGKKKKREGLALFSPAETPTGKGLALPINERENKAMHSHPCKLYHKNHLKFGRYAIV